MAAITNEEFNNKSAKYEKEVEEALSEQENKAIAISRRLCRGCSGPSTHGLWAFGHQSGHPALPSKMLKRGEITITSKWFKISMTLGFALTVCLTLSIYSMVTTVQVNKYVTIVVQQMSDSQKSTYTGIQASSQKQTGNIDLLGDTLAERMSNLTKEIQKASRTDQINGTLQRNRQKIHSIYDDVDFDVDLLEAFVRNRLSAIYATRFADQSAALRTTLSWQESKIGTVVSELETATNKLLELNETLAKNNKKTELIEADVQAMEPRHARLTGGGDHNGTVEVFHHGLWGTICGIKWDLDDGHVLCRMLGYESAASVGNVTGGSGPIWLSDVECSGLEQTVWDCEKAAWGVNSCDHSTDASLVCSMDRLDRYY